MEQQQVDTNSLSSPSTPSILLVDDDTSTLVFMKAALQKKGFQVTTATTGEIALELLSEKAIDLVLLDACLPKMDGFAICKEIRKSNGNESTPVFMVTGLDDKDSINKAFENGATDYIAKPINIHILSKKLELTFSPEWHKRIQLERQSVINAISRTHDFVISIDENGTLIDEENSLPSTLFATLNHYWSSNGYDTNFPASLKNGDEIIVESQQGRKAYRLKMRLFRSSPKTWEMGVVDETDKMLSELQQSTHQSTGLPNSLGIQKYISQAFLFSERLPFNCGVIQLKNYRNLETLLGDNQTVNYLNALVQQTRALLPNSFQLFHTDADTFIFIDLSLSANQFAMAIESMLASSGEELTRGNNTTFEFVVGYNSSHVTHIETLECIRGAQLAAQYAASKGLTLAEYSKDLNGEMEKRTNMERLLRRDLDAQKLELYFQPKFDTKTLALSGVEALLRWHSKELGFVSPGEFIPLAESTNMMRQLSRLVIKKALGQILIWQKQSPLSVPVSINLDATNLADDLLVDELIHQVQTLKIKPHLVEVEVTESVLVTGESKAIFNLNKLRNIGIKVAMDDFGTGYSSFNYLYQLPLDTLKIDMSFIRQIEHNPKVEAITASIIKIGHDIGLEVIAEGVENETQLRKLSQLGCDLVQGYLTGKPVPSAEFNCYFDGPTCMH